MAWTDLTAYAAGRFTVAMAELLRGNFKAIGDPWTSYGTPSTLWTAVTTNPTIGNGTCTGRYMQAGKWVQGSISVVFGSTTTAGSGNYQFLFPVTPLNQRCMVGKADLLDASASTPFARVTVGINGTNFVIADFANARVSNASPITWATGDRIDIGFTYEAA